MLLFRRERRHWFLLLQKVLNFLKTLQAQELLLGYVHTVPILFLNIRGDCAGGVYDISLYLAIHVPQDLIAALITISPCDYNIHLLFVLQLAHEPHQESIIVLAFLAEVLEAIPGASLEPYGRQNI